MMNRMRSERTLIKKKSRLTELQYTFYLDTLPVDTLDIVSADDNSEKLKVG